MHVCWIEMNGLSGQISAQSTSVYGFRQSYVQVRLFEV